MAWFWWYNDNLNGVAPTRAEAEHILAVHAFEVDSIESLHEFTGKGGISYYYLSKEEAEADPSGQNAAVIYRGPLKL